MVAADERRRSGGLDRRPVKILTDTHTLVWALSNPAALGPGARAALAGSPFTASVANLWELLLKSRKPGALIADPVLWWEKYVVGPQIPTLAIRTGHILKLASLPDLHKDPFDRILVAQALAEGLTLATKDGVLARYHVSVVWDDEVWLVAGFCTKGRCDQQPVLPGEFGVRFVGETNDLAGELFELLQAAPIIGLSLKLH
jgi:PIN domain nuclease of toxin-antitoxin system